MQMQIIVGCICSPARADMVAALGETTGISIVCCNIAVALHFVWVSSSMSIYLQVLQLCKACYAECKTVRLAGRYFGTNPESRWVLQNL